MVNLEASFLLCTLTTRPKDSDKLQRWADLRPQMMSRKPNQIGSYTLIIPEGRVLFTERLPEDLDPGIEAAVKIPRGYGSIMLEHRTLDVRGFRIWKSVKRLRGLRDNEGFLHSLHKVGSDGTEALLGVGFNAETGIYQSGAKISFTHHEIPIAEKSDRVLVLTAYV